MYRDYCRRGMMRGVTTHRGEDPAAMLPTGEPWSTRREPWTPGGDAPVPSAGVGTPFGVRSAGPPPAQAARDASEGERQQAARSDGFDPADTGTWRVRDVVPGADGGRRHTTILRYLLGLIAVDHVRSMTRWTFAVPVLGLALLVITPRWIGLAVLVLGVLLVLTRFAAVRLITRRSEEHT